jgi:hypothetical protein
VNGHPTDLLALLCGLGLAAAGAAFLVHETTGRSVDGGWVTAVGLIVLGLVALVVTLIHGGHADTPEERAEP